MMYQRLATHRTTSNQEVNQEINSEQFAQIITAILNGKYSWACVLLLRFSGHNPTHYIPYRTYNRILKENCQVGRSNKGKGNNSDIDNRQIQQNGSNSQQCLRGMADLTYLEVLDEPHTQVHGGGSAHTCLNHQGSSMKVLWQIKDKLRSIWS